jgi:hypothetical protein
VCCRITSFTGEVFAAVFGGQITLARSAVPAEATWGKRAKKQHGYLSARIPIRRFHNSLLLESNVAVLS